MATVIFVFYITITLTALVSLILFGSRPSKSLSWLLVITALPFAGVLLYVFFGINRRKIKFFKLKKIDEMREYALLHSEAAPPLSIQSGSEQQKKIASLIANSTGTFPDTGNKIIILDDGRKTMEAIFAALERAEKFIHIQFYIIEEGELMERLYRLFAEKIREGVEIRVIYDAIGSFFLGRKHIKRFREIGVKVYAAMPLRFGSILFTINYRNHRKIIVIDGKTGFTGGVNISDKYIKPSENSGIWDDMHLCLRGPVTESLHRVFIKDYYFASNGENLWQPEYFPENKEEGHTTAQIVSGGPDSDYASIMYQYATLINHAEKYICIANPYFIPSITILENLKMAALSGVEVKLLVPKKSDRSVVRYGMFSYFEELLSAGVMIFEHPVKFLHSKMIIIDDEISSVGSGNFDNRSFDQNFELNTLIFDTAIAVTLREDFEQDCREADKLVLSEFVKRPLIHKLLEGIARIFSPLL
ncbi:cardiolipin synthase [Sinomicrobium soli]|nr:cardiolipin synthase [Sinomicrobium sp. N-1-3-6]